MRISTITNWAYGATLLLTGLSGAAFILSEQSDRSERIAVEQHLALDDLGEELALGSEKRSDEARLYVMRQSVRHLDAYRQEERSEQRRERAIARLEAQDLAPTERDALKEAARNLDELDAIEHGALGAAAAGEWEGARAALFGPDHERAQSSVLEPVRRFRAIVAARTNARMHEAKLQSDWYNDIARALLALTAVLFLAVLYFVLRRRVAMPLIRMTGIVTRLAKQDYSVELPTDRRRDEIGDMTKAIHTFRDNGIERSRLEAERASEQRVKDLILQMMHRLQATATKGELAEVVACFAPQTFPDLAGHLYVLNAARSSMVMAASWLDPLNDSQSFSPTACWGLRRGRPHASHRGNNDIPCPHIGTLVTPSLCVPLSAQGETIGMLYFEERDGCESPGDASRLYIELMAENIGLALANLELREQLTYLAIRDGLTGLFNRRHLDETLNRIGRDGHAVLACLMVDIDHFKRFNDTFGHEAGDMVIQHVAGIMLDAVGAAGQVYRFGGEEFTVLLPGQTEESARALAEQLRNRVREAPLAHRGHMMGHISISVGIAAAVTPGSASNLIVRADAALLEAKARGRNCVISAAELSDNGQAGECAA